MREKPKPIDFRKVIERIKVYKRMLETGESLEQATAVVQSKTK